MSAVGRVVTVLKRAFESGKREVEAADPSRQFDKLFAGSEEQIAERWQCSAVLLKGDKWAVVPFENAARVEGSARCVRVAELGTMTGRVHLRDAAWFRANAVRIYLGALSLPDGDGANAAFAGGTMGTCKVKVTPLASQPADGRWAAAYQLGDEAPEAMELRAALIRVGAAATEVQEGEATEEEADEDAQLQLRNFESPLGARELLGEALESLGLDMDMLRLEVSADEVAQLLGAVAGAEQMGDKIGALMAQPMQGGRARAAVMSTLLDGGLGDRFHTWHGSRKTGRRPIFRTRIAPRHLKLSELGLKFLRAPDCVQPTHHFAACGGRRNTARRARQSSVPFFVTQRPVFHVPHFGTFHMAARGLAELAHGSYTL